MMFRVAETSHHNKCVGKDPMLGLKYKRDVEAQKVRLFQVDIKHNSKSTWAKHVSIKDLGSVAKDKQNERDFIFCLRTRNPTWRHENDLVASPEASAALKRHADTILESLLQLTSRSDRSAPIRLGRRGDPFSYGHLYGECISTSALVSGLQWTQVRYWLHPEER